MGVNIFNLLIFPGVFFIIAGALAVSWTDRKISAFLQWRTGPSLMQPFYDLLKLMGKETVIPEGAIVPVFLAAPLAGFSAALLASVFIVGAVLPAGFPGGDIIILYYLLIIPPVMIVMGGAASGNPVASIGASRKMKLLMAGELPFILAVTAVLIRTGGELSLEGISGWQSAEGAVAGSVSGILAFLVTLFCFQAKSAQGPFDMPESEGELMGGPYIEYGGAPLGFFRLSGNILTAVLPLLAVILFLGDVNGIPGFLKYAGVLMLVIILKNVTPRLRVNQALRLFWGPVTLAGALAVLLAAAGL